MKTDISLSAVLSRFLLTAAVSLVALQPVMAAEDGSSLRGEIGLRYDDNLSLSPGSDDEVDDKTVHVGLVGDFIPWSSNLSSLTMGGGLHYDYVEDTTDLSNYGVTLSALFRHEYGADLTAPWVSLGVDWTAVKYDDSDIRDGYIWEAAATIGKRLNPTIGLSGGYKYFDRTSTEDDPDQPARFSNTGAEDVFDLSRHNLFARADFQVTNTITFYGDATWFDGDVAASGVSFKSGASFDRGQDSAFGSDYIVWKLEADGYLAKLGMTWAITDSFNIDASAEHLSADGEKSNDYENTAFQVVGSYSFH